MNKHSILRGALPRRTALALALGLGFSGLAIGQSTVGSIFGHVANGANETVTIQGTTGVTRTLTVDSAGNYRASSLPLGTYTVTLSQNGSVVDTRKNVSITVGGGTEVSFGGASVSNAVALSAVTVTGSALPAIDISSVSTSTVIDAKQLSMLPLGRSAESISLLAPGAGIGSGNFSTTTNPNGAVSFGGSGVTENAYYINGFNTTNPLSNLGGIGLPYGAIDQQQVYTGGYSAMYGRSDGGVISQVGKRGTNEWHFGGQFIWAPVGASSSPGDIYYPNKAFPAGFGYENKDLPGTIYRRREGDKSWTKTYSAYVGGPLIKDKLYLFLAAESEKQEGVSTNSSASSIQARNHYKYDLPKFYGKIDWNINDSNILELSHVRSTTRYSGVYNAYDYATNVESGPTGSYPNTTKISSKYDIAKYTGYLTDDLTLSATWGRSTTGDYQTNPSDNGVTPYLSGVTNQNPLYTGGTPIKNSVGTSSSKDPDAKNTTRGLRVDLEYRLGDHDLSAGIDNMSYWASNEGQSMSGPGYAWIYSHASNPSKAISPSLGVGAPGGNGYYVRKYIFSTTTSMSAKQTAQYVQDRWQVSNNLLLSLGLRNDKFVNKNNVGATYVDSGNQWAPRLGASWDVFGDSSLKVYGNLGRYYLALPNSVAIRGASASTYTNEYFDYVDIKADGSPVLGKALGPGPVSTNNEYGQAPDAKSVTATDLKSQYQDEFIVGFDKKLGESWVTGASLNVRKLQTAIDDVCDTGKIADKLAAEGINPDSVTIPGCVIFNPGETNTFSLANVDGNGRTSVRMSMHDWGFTSGAKRKYYALNTYLEHPFDGKWQGRIDYTFSRSYGNTEGQVKSDTGQTDTSKTSDWDAAALMQYSNGILSNDRTHQIKIRGAYAITPEWMVSGVLIAESGTPKNCLGYVGPTQEDPVGYSSYYHYCLGQPSRPGDAGRNPWTHMLDLAVTYRPSFADHKLAISLQGFNVLNERRRVQTYANNSNSVAPYTITNTYGMGEYFEQPRYARLQVTYDF
ncbi:MAG TPA: TonB-dependent receptor [Rhodanobacter sp.]|nr:TonB-dependent receptor [Rhodanobacter sp.]